VRQESAVLLYVANFSSEENRGLGANIFVADSHLTALRLNQTIETAQ
jgi:hypothetical protein